MIYSEVPRHDRTDIKVMSLMEWVRDYCASGEKLLVVVSQSGGVTLKCLVNLETGDKFIVEEL